jgi:SAM-dependent methyltransferase
VVEDWRVSGRGYDRAASARLEQAYTTRDVQEQRDAVRRALQAHAGEEILDLGSGPGILACELAIEVGRGGRVTAVDVSVEMNAIASRRAHEAGLGDRIDVVRGDALALAFPDACFDAAVSTQVLEYVDDVGRALRSAVRPSDYRVAITPDSNTRYRALASLGDLLDCASTRTWPRLPGPLLVQPQSPVWQHGDRRRASTARCLPARVQLAVAELEAVAVSRTD